MKHICRFSVLCGLLIFTTGLFAQPAEFGFQAGCNEPVINAGFGMIGIVAVDGSAPPVGSWIAVFNSADEVVGRGQLQEFEFPAGSGTFAVGFSINVQDSPAGASCPIHTPNLPLQLRYYDAANSEVLATTPASFPGTVTTGNIDGPDGDAADVDIYSFSTSLPVSLVDFTATPNDQQVNLNWATSEETDNSHFEIERSANPESGFENIGKVLGNATTGAFNNYAFTDEVPTSGVNYYRLRQVDFDGGFEYSAVISVEMNISSDRQLAVFPNPAASNGRLTINLQGDWAKGATEIRLVDAAGRLVNEWKNVTVGSTNTQLPALPAGMYQLIAKDEQEQKAVRLMVR
ncbi:T9SS type A sorting domain-containing protein [Neolewinella agarilytica]|uniref:Por secretion system C-terminal sorting domain-containing protein n=1 Tax=Neolewinella agarilytica TaxID=478744 RepID=A0A1H9FMZ2_9BACT|nr:T9SS type A sorting domain-containing protein [Neolewinella agarilytica]SEQ39235.1 Por secretion system C-terminal sorting domain-containing protein [Neolewinella agarilytica]